MPRWLALVNHMAGRKAVDPDVVANALRTAGVDADVEAPRSAQAAMTTLREEAQQGRTHFALVGGDGTVNLAANALLPLTLNPKPVIGVLPTGTGCDLLRTFALPQDLAGAARHLATDATYDIDVVAVEGAWGHRYFVNVAQTGVGAAAAVTATRLSRRLGPVRYPIAFGLRLPLFPRGTVRVSTERRTVESTALAVIVANAQFFAGGWNVAPRATLVDGVVDIQVIDVAKTRAPALVPKVIRGTHLADRAVRRWSAAEFSIETEPAWPVEADGDPLGNTPIRGRVVPAALRLKI
ncbi:MAG: diacylglycerol/lipid kinase family protein [Acidimicrobiia bacterium]